MPNLQFVLFVISAGKCLDNNISNIYVYVCVCVCVVYLFFAMRHLFTAAALESTDTQICFSQQTDREREREEM